MSQLIQIIGAGQMGCGIAEVCLTHGYKVHLVDLDERQREKAKERLFKRMPSISDLSPDLSLALSFDAALKKASTHGIIEAVPENLSLKEKVWNSVSAFAQEHTTYFSESFFASNTSSYSITTLSDFFYAPHIFLGLHFMNPVPKMALVEVIDGEKTSQSTRDSAIGFVKSLQKEPVMVKDAPGFIVNRLLIPFLNEAVKLLETRIASKEDIDKAMTLGASHPMGPLKLADFIGLDTCKAILDDLYMRLQNQDHKPSPLWDDYIQQGFLGKKSGKGFYEYS